MDARIVVSVGIIALLLFSKKARHQLDEDLVGTEHSGHISRQQKKKAVPTITVTEEPYHPSTPLENS